MIAFLRASGVKFLSMNSRTSLPRSPISPTTITSASVFLVIIPINTLLPTPLPAIKPIRWPLPTVNSPLIARTPTLSGVSTGRRFSGLIGFGSSETRSPP